jgi:RNA polymerase sigma-70 factor (ECF subfamily)
MELLSRTERAEWAIVAEIYAPLRRFAAVVAPFDLEPDDLLQEALVAVLRAHRLSELDHPAAYIRKALLRVAVSHNRRMGRRRRADARLASTAAVGFEPNYPSDLVELLELPPRERAALYLHEVEAYRYSEIAEMLGCSEAAATKAGARGRKRFERLVAEEVAG